MEAIMSAVTEYPVTRQGVRDLDNPIRRTENAVNVGQTERTASTIGGAVLAGIGLTKGGLEGLLLMAVGGALAYRGYSGHCAAYAASGINTAK
jgi:uncharacterized membrane protein